MSDAPKTVRVRIAVAVDADGAAEIVLSRDDDKDANTRLCEEIAGMRAPIVFHWIEADVPVPVATTIAGTVKTA